MKNAWWVLVVFGAACGGPLEPATADETTSSGERLKNTGPCPGTWGAVPNYDGLGGTFTRASGWPAAKGDILNVTFSSASPSGSGSASRWVQGGAVMQTGGFSATPDNPAIGAVISFGGVGYPTDGSPAKQLYFVAGLNRNALGQVKSVCLGGTNFGTWFILNRVW